MAALIYVIAALALRSGRRGVLAVAASIELVGVLVVGALSGSFPGETVWSDFGAGYGFVPLVLPVAALLWLVYGEQTSRPSVKSRSAAP